MIILKKTKIPENRNYIMKYNIIYIISENIFNLFSFYIHFKYSIRNKL